MINEQQTDKAIIREDALVISVYRNGNGYMTDIRTPGGVPGDRFPYNFGASNALLAAEHAVRHLRALAERERKRGRKPRGCLTARRLAR